MGRPQKMRKRNHPNSTTLRGKVQIREFNREVAQTQLPMVPSDYSGRKSQLDIRMSIKPSHPPPHIFRLVILVSCASLPLVMPPLRKPKEIDPSSKRKITEFFQAGPAAKRPALAEQSPNASQIHILTSLVMTDKSRLHHNQNLHHHHPSLRRRRVTGTKRMRMMRR
jgi:hypothetical protein